LFVNKGGHRLNLLLERLLTDKKLGEDRE